MAIFNLLCFLTSGSKKSLGISSLLAAKNLSGLGGAFKSFKLAVFMALKSPVLYLLDAGGCKKLAQFRYIFETWIEMVKKIMMVKLQENISIKGLLKMASFTKELSLFCQ